MYKECLRIIEKKMPKVIVFENVRGLLSTKYIDGRKLVDVIVEDLSTMNNVGYNVDYKLINASDYGVPQNRQRVLFVGIRKDLGINFAFPEKQEKKGLTLENILDIPQGVKKPSRLAVITAGIRNDNVYSRRRILERRSL